MPERRKLSWAAAMAGAAMSTVYENMLRTSAPAAWVRTSWRLARWSRKKPVF
jgi:hypothetical protein